MGLTVGPRVDDKDKRHRDADDDGPVLRRRGVVRHPSLDRENERHEFERDKRKKKKGGGGESRGPELTTRVGPAALESQSMKYAHILTPNEAGQIESVMVPISRVTC